MYAAYLKGEEMPGFCRGAFNEETKCLLKEDSKKGGIAYLSQPCAICGQHVLAENKAGEWVPKLHPRLATNRGLKDYGRKR
jgi:hypothetical protein